MKFKNMMPVPDSVHGFWWKAARWEVFLALFLVYAFLTARYFPDNFVTVFSVQFGLLCVQLLGSLLIPAGFRLYTRKQSSIAVSAVFSCSAVIIFGVFNPFTYVGRIPIGSALHVLYWVLTMVAGYKIVRKWKK